MENPFNKKIEETTRCSVDWDKIDYFDQDEFDDPDHPGSWKYMDPLTVLELNDIRKKTGWPIITHNKFGLKGCVCMEHVGHEDDSAHFFDSPKGCSAVDFHFDNDVDPRVQAGVILKSKFTGIGVYYDWQWRGMPLSIGFHVDRRRIPQLWRREEGKYFYLLK